MVSGAVGDAGVGRADRWWCFEIARESMGGVDEMFKRFGEFRHVVVVDGLMVPLAGFLDDDAKRWPRSWLLGVVR
jgi:hypothetical protein